MAGVLFNKTQSTLIQYPPAKGVSYTIPNSVTNIGYYAFSDCTSLTSVYFNGNALTIYDLFANNKVTVYYLAGTTGWSPTFGICPTKLWNLHPTALEIKVKTVQVTMHLTPTKKYQLQSALDLTTWMNVGDPFVASTSEVVQEFSAIELGRYFRLLEVQQRSRILFKSHRLRPVGLFLSTTEGLDFPSRSGVPAGDRLGWSRCRCQGIRAVCLTVADHYGPGNV